MLDVFQSDDWCTVVQGTPKFQPPEIVSGTSERYRYFFILLGSVLWMESLCFILFGTRSAVPINYFSFPQML